MRQLILTAKFKRALRKFVARNPKLQVQVEETLRRLAADASSPQLGTHQLQGKLAGFKACSCGYDCRIIFSLELQPDTGEEVIVLVNVGNHDAVY